jgi:hypothetical protein
LCAAKLEQREHDIPWLLRFNLHRRADHMKRKIDVARKLEDDVLVINYMALRNLLLQLGQVSVRVGNTKGYVTG